MDFLEVRLGAPAASLSALADFYGTRLGMRVERGGERLSIEIGATQLEFGPTDGRPFYHFALLAPGDRFAELLEWAHERAELLPERDSGEVVFDFSNWQACACYFHDPAGNIVELIAHRGIGETAVEGPFAASELLGFSELGLVGEPAVMAKPLADHLGLELWDGTVKGPRQLAFVGEPGRTLILCPESRPWLPTGRAAEPHPVDAVLSGSPEGEVLLRDFLYRVRRGGRSRNR